MGQPTAVSLSPRKGCFDALVFSTLEYSSLLIVARGNFPQPIMYLRRTAGLFRILGGAIAVVYPNSSSS